ncbi:uncharacterized protein TNCV_4561921 [Trichonephila clavipes]|nr:uncharacterized protein TNCV_4561921 [Trichonephila clavipes]
MTKVRLELLTDIDMPLFIEKGIRGGVAMIGHRYAKANNVYLSTRWRYKDIYVSCGEKPYGDNIEIEKIECVGHVQKRMGSRLRKLKSSLGKKKLSDGKTIGEKGRLTDVVINRLTTFMGMQFVVIPKCTRNEAGNLGCMGSYS